MRVFLLLFLILLTCPFIYAQVPAASQMLRQQELLNKQKDLTQQLEHKGQVYITKIEIKGNTLLAREQIYDVASPFINKWLTIDEVEQLIDNLVQVYAAHQKEVSISYALEGKGILNIEIQERSSPGK
jgi:hypothetical protein